MSEQIDDGTASRLTDDEARYLWRDRRQRIDDYSARFFEGVAASLAIVAGVVIVLAAAAWLVSR